LGLALWGSSTALHAATIPVTNLADSGPGSLRDAIATAAAGDTIDATGIAGTIVLESELNVDKSLTLNGPGQDELILSGNRVTRVLHLSSATSTVNISGLTVADGHQSSTPGPDDQFSASGGIFSRATLTLSHCTIRGNSILSEAGWYGGGVTSLGSLTVTHCLISRNSGDAGQYGGGIVILGSGATTVVDSTIVHIGTTGIYASSFGGEFISRCTLSGNTVFGVVTRSSGWTIDHCTISGNGFYGL
jgi:parallel beta-helix repeat protein